MTNYNERLDEILEAVSDYVYFDAQKGMAIADSKQAITSLIKELVAEAKPVHGVMGGKIQRIRNGGRNIAIEEFEQNLLRELEQL